MSSLERALKHLENQNPYTHDVITRITLGTREKASALAQSTKETSTLEDDKTLLKNSRPWHPRIKGFARPPEDGAV